jgi:hypothetical protein
VEDVFRNPSRAIPPAVRAEVITRDGLTCRRCERPVTTERGGDYRPDRLHLDHVTPWAAGGEHSADNLIVSCADCNLRRPKPQTVVRAARIRYRYQSGTYWWEEGYDPPVLLAGRCRTYSVRGLSQYLSLSVVNVLRMAAAGQLAASGWEAGPIRVELPIEFAAREQELERERRRAARARSNAAMNDARRDPTRGRRNDPRPLDPERVAYWQGVIDARRAREAAQRSARRATR